jgi:hypothetical protein
MMEIMIEETNNREKNLRIIKKREEIKGMLLKYTDPKPQYDGLTADELSKMILEILTAIKIIES